MQYGNNHSEGITPGPIKLQTCTLCFRIFGGVGAHILVWGENFRIGENLGLVEKLIYGSHTNAGQGAEPFGLVPFGLVPFGLVPSGLGPVGLLYCLVYCTFWSTVPFGLEPYGLLYHLV